MTEEKQQMDLSKQDIIKIITRQTDYTYEQAEESLTRNGTVEKCIEEYLGLNKKKEEPKLSTNQAIYKSIREWMN
jgi:hypothetical protein